MYRHARVACVSAGLLVAVPSHAQFLSMCSGLEEAANWPPELDAVTAAPKNHRVLFESDSMRILEVTVLPNERENLHHHRWPSVMIVDARPKYVNYDKDGNEIKPSVPPQERPDLPIVARLGPQPAHAVHNIDGISFHAIRIEYKKGCPTQ